MGKLSGLPVLKSVIIGHTILANPTHDGLMEKVDDCLPGCTTAAAGGADEQEDRETAHVTSLFEEARLTREILAVKTTETEGRRSTPIPLMADVEFVRYTG